MSFIHGKATSILMNGVDASTFLNEATLSRSRETGDTTVFQKDAKTYIPGLADATLSVSGLYDGSTGSSDESFRNELGSTNPTYITHSPAGLSLGNPANLIDVKETSFEISSPVADVTSVSAEFQASGGVDRGVALTDLSARTTSSNGTGHDNGASTSNGGVMHAHVTALSAGASATPVIQHSADNVTFVDLATGTAMSAKGAQRVEVTSGTLVNRYTRAKWTIAGGTPSVTLGIAFARR